MDKDMFCKVNGVSWLSSSRSSLINPFLGFSRSVDIPDPLKPRESLYEQQVSRNLNASFGINLLGGQVLPQNSNSCIERLLNDDYLTDLSRYNTDQYNDKDFFGSFENSSLQDELAKYSNIDISPNSLSLDSNVSPFLPYLNEEKRIFKNQNDISDSVASSLFSANSISSNENMASRKSLDMSFTDCFEDPYIRPSLYKTPTKTNTDLVALMQELALMTEPNASSNLPKQNMSTPFQSSLNPPLTTSIKGCVFCKNNSYHSTFYKSHVLKDDRGLCQCPVLRTYVCPLCGGTGDAAHTLKYCPRNTVTRGDPIAAGLPPGKVTNWREVATKMAFHQKL